MTAVPERLVVLLADDDRNEITLIRRAFQRLKAGFVVDVPDGDNAVDYLRGHGNYSDRTLFPLPRMLVLDQWMPGLSGLDVLRWVRSDPKFQSLPVVVLTDSAPTSNSELLTRLRAAFCI